MTTLGKVVFFFLVIIILALIFIVGVKSQPPLESKGQSISSLFEPQYLRFEGHLPSNGLHRYDDGHVICIIVKSQNDVEMNCKWNQ